MKPKLLHKLSDNKDDFVSVDSTSPDFSDLSGIKGTFLAQSTRVVNDAGDYVKSDDSHLPRFKKHQESIGGVINLTAQEIETIFDSTSKMYGIAD